MTNGKIYRKEPQYDDALSWCCKLYQGSIVLTKPNIFTEACIMTMLASLLRYLVVIGFPFYRNVRSNSVLLCIPSITKEMHGSYKCSSLKLKIIVFQMK